AAANPLVERAFAGEKITYEREALWPGRENRRIRGHMIPDVDEAGNVLGILIVLIDIEEDHQLRRALEEKESQLRHFAENIPEAIAVVDREFHFIFTNKMYQRTRGHPGRDLAGRPIRDILDPEVVSRFVDGNIERLRRGESCIYERMVPAAGD